MKRTRSQCRERARVRNAVLKGSARLEGPSPRCIACRKCSQPPNLTPACKCCLVRRSKAKERRSCHARRCWRIESHRSDNQCRRRYRRRMPVRPLRFASLRRRKTEADAISLRALATFSGVHCAGGSVTHKQVNRKQIDPLVFQGPAISAAFGAGWHSSARRQVL